MAALSEADLKERARQLLVAMTEQERWVYALERSGRLAMVTELLSEHGIPCVEEARLDEPGDDQAAGDAAPVARYANEAQTLQFVVFESPELDVVLLQGEGGAAVPILGKMLERTGFVPQSHLWNAAVSVAEPGASRALKTLAHMAVEWDEEWTDMFVLHLASPDAIARHEAVAALSIAAMVAREVEPALMLLDEAIQRERFPKLRETMGEARRLLEAYSGMPVEPD